MIVMVAKTRGSTSVHVDAICCQISRGFSHGIRMDLFTSSHIPATPTIYRNNSIKINFINSIMYFDK